MLKLLFEQFAGFKSVTLPTNSVGTALVQFKQADHAAVALNGLQGFKLNPTHTLSLSYSPPAQLKLTQPYTHTLTFIFARQSN